MWLLTGILLDFKIDVVSKSSSGRKNISVSTDIISIFDFTFWSFLSKLIPSLVMSDDLNNLFKNL